MSVVSFGNCIPQKIEDKRLQEFKALELNRQIDDTVIFSLLRDFEYTKEYLSDSSQISFFSSNPECFIVDSKGKYGFSQCAKIIHSRLIKIFINRANEIFTQGLVDRIVGSFLPTFIFLCCRFLRSISGEDIAIGLEKIKGHYTLDCLFNEGESIIRKYPRSVKQAILNNSFFIVDLLMSPEKYYSAKLDLRKEEIGNMLLQCLSRMEARKSLSPKEEFLDPNLLTESGIFINFLRMIKNAGRKWKVQFQNCWFQYDDIPKDIKILDVDQILPKLAIVTSCRIEVQMPYKDLTPEIEEIISGERDKKKKLLKLLFLYLPLQDLKGRAMFLPEGCPFYGDKHYLQLEYPLVYAWYRNLKKYKGYSLENLIEYFYNVYVVRQIDGFSFHLKMSSSRNWVEKLRNNFQEEEIVFDICQDWCESRTDSLNGQKLQFLCSEELNFRDYLLNDQNNGKVNRIPENKALRNFYIHDRTIHTFSNEKYESDYVELLHFMIFEMEKLNFLLKN